MERAFRGFLSSRPALFLSCLSALAFVLCPSRAAAFDAGDRIQLHGYGEWWYGRTSSPGTVYTGATSEGNYTNVNAALNVAAQPTDQILVVIQPHFSMEEEREFIFDPGTGAVVGVDVHPAAQVDLDYAFAEWRFSDELRFRAGLVKLPFGIYNEIFDVGTLRPFLHLPQGLYGPQGVIGKAYQGGGVTGRFELWDGMDLQYDLYGGQMITDIRIVPALPPFNITASDLVGGRIVLSTPIEGLSVGASGYVALRSGSFSSGQEIRSVGLHVDYTRDDFSLRTEVVHHGADNIIQEITGYTEAAVMVTENVQAAARIDWYKAEFVDPLLQVVVPEPADEHLDVGGGLNYWFNGYFVIKSAYHFIKGNRHSLPESHFPDFSSPYSGPPLDETNHLFEIGAQFSF